VAENYQQNISAWRKKTGAKILTETEFMQVKAAQNFHVTGVIGFAGAWDRTPANAPLLIDARRTLRAMLLAGQQQYGSQLIMCSGATDSGVLHLAYELCEQLGITAMGVTPDIALDFDVAKMEYLVPVGHNFGDESETFLRICDEFMLLGGGNQSRREIITAANMGKPITVIQGFGGAADDFSPERLPRARFVSGWFSTD